MKQMNTYRCDVWLEFPERNGKMLVGQLFTVEKAGDIQAEAEQWYKKHAGAEKVIISSYQLV